MKLAEEILRSLNADLTTAKREETQAQIKLAEAETKLAEAKDTRFNCPADEYDARCQTAWRLEADVETLKEKCEYCAGKRFGIEWSLNLVEHMNRHYGDTDKKFGDPWEELSA